MTQGRSGRGTARGVGRPVASRSKYRSTPTMYNGVRYHSKAEAARAAELDLLLKAGEIMDWIAQPTVRLGIPENVYRPDFLVMQRMALHPRALEAFGLASDQILGGSLIAWYEDIKGMETPKFKRDKVLWKRYGRLPLSIRKNGKEVERIEPDGK